MDKRRVPGLLWLATVVVAARLIGPLSPSPASEALPGRQVQDEGADHVPEGTPIPYRHLPPGKYQRVKLVVAPYPKMKRRLAILAWNRIDEMDNFDADRILAFYRAHVDRGSEDVP